MPERTPKTPSPDQSQHDRFKQIARDLGWNEDEEAFKRALGKVARHKPKEEKQVASPEKDK